MTSFSVKEICKKIWELEEKYNLLYKDIQGVKIWQYLRMDIYYKIAQKTEVFIKPHASTSLIDKLKAIPKYLYNSIVNNPLVGSYRKDILIFDHPRKKLVDGEYIDIYTHDLLNEFKDKEYEVLEKPYLTKHWTDKQHNRKYLDFLDLSSYFTKKVFNINFTHNELKFINNIETKLEDYFKINLNLKGKFSEGISRFNYNYKFYDKLFKKRKPKKIFLVVSYGKGALVSVAKNNGIEVIEIQHGTISPYHLGYNFPNSNYELDYFPDKFYSFGSFWEEMVDFPIDSRNIISYGFSFMKKRKKQFENITKKKKQILFISQGVIGKELSKYAYKLSRMLSNYEIIYKLHPGEYDRWIDEYEYLIKAKELDNFTVVDNNKKDLYHYFAESEYQVGVFSTAVYEGMSFNCKTVLVDLPGIEYMEHLIEKEVVKKVSTPKALKKVIINFTGTTLVNFFD